MELAESLLLLKHLRGEGREQHYSELEQKIEIAEASEQYPQLILLHH